MNKTLQYFGSVAVIAALVALGCSGGGGGGKRTSAPVVGGDIAPDAEVGKGKVGKTMSLILSPSMYAVAKANPSAYPAGSRFDDGTSSVVLPPTSLKGILIYANDVLIGSTDSAGNVRLIRQPSSGETITFRENHENPSFGNMSASEFASAVSGGRLVLSIAVDEAQNAQSMDGRPVTRDDGDQEGCGTDCGSATFTTDLKVSKKPSCCLDYNGVASSGNPPTDPCDPDTSFLVYPGSTCHSWVYDEVCGHGWQRHVSPGATDAGQCDRWHRGRYCAAINDSAFKVTDSASSHGPSRKVNVGDTVTFTVLNNTRNNETVINRDKGDDHGTLTAGPELEASGGNAFLLKHYDDAPGTHSGFTWFEERTVTYTAALPAGVEEATVTFTFGQMHPQTISIRVCR
ncbi:hypothetical protein EON82_15620 [bacterium]|nr:MAG: hypothetical protein EON82_15620 [bacterium]